MDGDALAIWLFVAGWGWIIFALAGSALYRRLHDKPIIPRAPAAALFVEKWASSLWANNCLLVAATRELLLVTPRFPFTLLFLPEIYRLEHRIPIRSIRRVSRRQRAFSNNIIIRHGPDERQLRLRLRDPDGLIAVLAKLGVPTGEV